MEKERGRAIKAMEEKDLASVQYQHLSDVIDKFTKNIQLLSGKDTERIGFSLSKMFKESQDDKPKLES